jgi:hypothetical protein
MDAGGWIFMALANIIIWGLIIAFIVWLVRDLRTRPHRHHITSGASARDPRSPPRQRRDQPREIPATAHDTRHETQRPAARDRKHSRNRSLTPP